VSINGLIGKKIGMTQLFREDGSVASVTAIEAGPCTVTQVRTPSNDGYTAVQLGYGASKKLTKPEIGHLKRSGTDSAHLREVSVSDLAEVQVGQQFGADLFTDGELVDIVGISKGRGFTGVVKRHGFSGGPKTHGQSDRLRAPGSIGGTTYPGRVLKGTKMAGQFGNHRVTARKLEIVQVDVDRNLLFINGGVPGPSRGLILIKRSRKSGK